MNRTLVGVGVGVSGAAERRKHARVRRRGHGLLQLRLRQKLCREGQVGAVAHQRCRVLAAPALRK